MRRSFVVLSACLLMSGPVRAADPASTYAVVSIVGDRMTVVGYQPSTGSNLDQNRRLELPLTDAHFDQLAARVATASILRASPDAAVESVSLQDRLPSDLSQKSFSDALPSLVSAVRPLLKRDDTHFLIVISKSTGEARLRLRAGFIGSGTLSGLGFYIDESKRSRNSRTGERGSGYIAPYAYVQVSLVDLRTGAVVRTESANESSTIANTGSTLDPWDALTAEEKVRQLDGVLGRAVRQAAPLVLGAS